jgi:predicted nucleic acid-binding protein
MFGGPDRRIIISRLAGVELHSALALKTRTGHLDREGSAALRIRFFNDVASGAIRYGDRQGLRTLDALQLAVALESQDRVGLEAFVAADKVLCEVATLEGFAVLNPEQP